VSQSARSSSSHPGLLVVQEDVHQGRNGTVDSGADVAEGQCCQLANVQDLVLQGPCHSCHDGSRPFPLLCQGSDGLQSTRSVRAVQLADGVVAGGHGTMVLQGEWVPVHWLLLCRTLAGALLMAPEGLECRAVGQPSELGPATWGRSGLRRPDMMESTLVQKL